MPRKLGLPFCSSTCFIYVFDLLTAPLEHHDLNLFFYVSAKHPLILSWILNFLEIKNKLTRMHSSRMLTTRFSGRLYREGGLPLELGGSVCLWVWGGVFSASGSGGVYHTFSPHLLHHTPFTTPPFTTPPFITTLFHHTPISPHTPFTTPSRKRRNHRQV